MYNDFDLVVSEAFDEIIKARRLLSESGAEAVLLAGSGSAVFGVFPTNEAAQAAADRLRSEFGSVFVTRALPRPIASKP
jgi:4-diphosphocytidyl-2-C-methyl-D-erythritol kinase